MMRCLCKKRGVLTRLLLLSLSLVCLSTLYAVDDPPTIGSLTNSSTINISDEWLKEVEKEWEESNKIYEVAKALYEGETTGCDSYVVQPEEDNQEEEEEEGESEELGEAREKACPQLFRNYCHVAKLARYYHILCNNEFSVDPNLRPRVNLLKKGILECICDHDSLLKDYYNLLCQYMMIQDPLAPHVRPEGVMQSLELDFIIKVLQTYAPAEIRFLAYQVAGISGSEIFGDSMKILKETYNLDEDIALRVLICYVPPDSPCKEEYIKTLFSTESVSNSKDAREALEREISSISWEIPKEQDMWEEAKPTLYTEFAGIWPTADQEGKFRIMTCIRFDNEEKRSEYWHKVLSSHEFPTQLVLDGISEIDDKVLQVAILEMMMQNYDPAKENRGIEPKEFFRQVLKIIYSEIPSQEKRDTLRIILVKNKHFVLSENWKPISKAIATDQSDLLLEILAEIASNEVELARLLGLTYCLTNKGVRKKVLNDVSKLYFPYAAMSNIESIVSADMPSPSAVEPPRKKGKTTDTLGSKRKNITLTQQGPSTGSKTKKSPAENHEEQMPAGGVGKGKDILDKEKREACRTKSKGKRKR